MLQRGAFHEFHGNKCLAVLLANFVDGADVGMIERRRRASLSSKALQHLRILCQLIGEKLERDKAAKEEILGFVDNTHAAATQHFDDSIVGDGLADHRAEYREAREKVRLEESESLCLEETVEIGK